LRAQLSPFEIFAAVAADAALADASIIPADMTEDQRDRTGVAIGSGIGCVEETAAAARTLTHDGPRGGPRRLSPYTLPKMLANLAGGQVSIRHGLRGPNHCVSTACTSGAHAVGDAFRFIKYGSKTDSGG
jgi:3-oxoacyl-[acyl-carrier-protein] synthase II